MKLTIDSRDLNYTIDTYGMFTGEHAEESEREYLQDEYDLTDEETRNLEYNYDHAGVVKALAEASVQLLHENFAQHGDGTVKDITLDKTQSPKFYNYTTDSYTAIWEIDYDKLQAHINANQSDFEAFVTEHWDYEYGEAIANTDTDTVFVIMLDYYTRQEYGAEEYEMAMFEHESEAWHENTALTPPSQAVIDQRERLQR